MKELLAVFVGGGLGSVIRYLIGFYMPFDTSKFPLHTLLANLLACMIFGIVTGYLANKLFDTEWQRAFLLAGICGGLSTFSTFSFELFIGGEQGRWGTMVLYLCLSVSLGIILIFFGYKIGRQL